MRAVASWGRLSAPPHDCIALHERERLIEHITRHTPGLAFGMGRSYGDVCLNSNATLWMTRALDRFLAFDEQKGVLVCEAGCLLRDIQRLSIPRGWMLPVTPGTQWVTVGGAIANDVHGKNHHRQGSFGDHVKRLRLVRTDGELIECGPDQRPDWYAATVGGLGLTGVIVQAEIQLCRVQGPWLDTETLAYTSLEEFFDLSDASEKDWEHTVAWIDCLDRRGHRGLFMRASPADTQEPSPAPRQPLSMPFTPPVSLVNRLSLRPFNMAYYALKKHRAGRAQAHYEPFLYPLDNLAHWNRMYGPQGFYQYQCVIPMVDAREATRRLLEEIARSGEGSFLAVLKTFGDRRSPGMLSFPRHGATLALDFPARGGRPPRLFERLDAIVRETGGRLYPAKDARMPRELFRAGYPHLDEFLTYRDPGIQSDMSRRLLEE